MSRPRNGARLLRFAFISIGLLLPLLTLIPLGSLWLWQNGYLLPWAGFAFVSTAIAFSLQWWVLRKGVPATEPGSARRPAAPAGQEPSGYTPREQAAWDAVGQLAISVKPSEIASRDDILALGVRTIETVARQIHPQERDPLWKFTVPEALALAERVSSRLRPAVIANVPLGDQLTVGQVLRMYEWRSVVGWAEKAYDVWRVVRMLNPVNAATQEARERLSKQLYSGLRDELTSRLVQAYVEEVGRAAIDLYGGRLKVDTGTLSGHVTDASRRDAETQRIAEPLRLLVAGQTGAGKSSLINALSGEVKSGSDILPATRGFDAYPLQHEGFPAALLIDSPGIGTRGFNPQQLVAAAADSDLILWVAAANNAGRQADLEMLQQIRSFFSQQTDRRPPPMLLVLTHADRLRPFNDWSPPYDLADAANEKVRSINDASAAAAADLRFGIKDVVPVCTEPAAGLYNIEAVWQRLAAALPDALHAQFVRTLSDAGPRLAWGRVWGQTYNAGKALAGRLVRTRKRNSTSK